MNYKDYVIEKQKVTKDDLRNKVVNIRNAVQALKDIHPEAWDYVSQKRRFKDVDSFHSYHFPALFLGTNLLYPKYNPDAVNHEELKQCVCIAVKASANNFPLFFAHKEVVNACLNTQTLETIDWKTMKMPFESMCIVLPQDLIKISGFDIAFLMITRLPKGGVKIPFSEEVITVPADCMIVNAVSTTLTNFRIVLQHPFVVGNIMYGKIRDNSPFEVPLNEKEGMFINKMTALIFNLIFVMEARPNLVEHQTKISHHKKSGETIYSPNTIGAKYRYQKSVPQGTHSSPSLHWRRGHFRRQPIGVKGSNNFKVIWIEPILIGAKGENK